MIPISLIMFAPLAAPLVALGACVAIDVRTSPRRDLPPVGWMRRFISYPSAIGVATGSAMFVAFLLFHLAASYGIDVSTRPGAGTFLGGPPLWLEVVSFGVSVLVGAALATASFFLLLRWRSAPCRAISPHA